MYGKYGTWKSMLSLNMGLSLLTGTKWLDCLDTPMPGTDVLYVQTEIPEKMLQERAEKMIKNFPACNGTKPIGHMLYLWTENYLKLDGGMPGYGQLCGHLEKLHPQVVIIDPLYKVMSGNFLKVEVAAPFLDSMDALIHKYKVAVVLVAHPRKGMAEQDNADDMMGSSLYADWADTIVRDNKIGGDLTCVRLRLEFLKVRHAQDFVEDLEVKIERVTLAATGQQCGISVQEAGKK